MCESTEVGALRFVPKKILVLGGSGIAGSMIVKVLRESGHQIHWTSRSPYRTADNLESGRSTLNVTTVNAYQDIVDLLEKETPSLIINALKHNSDEDNFTINAYIPAILERATAVPVFHISTNAVFRRSAERMWRATDFPCPETPYGMAKFLGERRNHLVIRTSIIGPRLSDQRSSISAYRKKYNCEWNGVTSLALAQYIRSRVSDIEKLGNRGELVHLCSQPFNWLALVDALRENFGIPPIPAEQNMINVPLLLSGTIVPDTLETQIAELARMCRRYPFGLEQ